MDLAFAIDFYAISAPLRGPGGGFVGQNAVLFFSRIGVLAPQNPKEFLASHAGAGRRSHSHPERTARVISGNRAEFILRHDLSDVYTQLENLRSLSNHEK